MRCGACGNKLEDHLAGGLLEAEAAALKAHLAGCDACRSKADALAAVQAVAAQGQAAWTPPPGFAEATRELAAATRPSALRLAAGGRSRGRWAGSQRRPWRRRYILLAAALLAWPLLAVLAWPLPLRRPAPAVLQQGDPVLVLLAALEPPNLTIAWPDFAPGNFTNEAGGLPGMQVWEHWLQRTPGDTTAWLRAAARAVGNGPSPKSQSAGETDWPGFRQTIRRIDELDRAAAKVHGELTASNLSERTRLLAAAYAPYPVYTSAELERWAHEERARGRDPQLVMRHRDELVARTRPSGNPDTTSEALKSLLKLRQAERWAVGAVRASPDNAYARYLRACTRMLRGDLLAWRAEMEAANELERLDTGRRDSVRRYIDEAVGKGAQPLWAALNGSAALVMPDLSKFREMARGAVAAADDERARGDERQAVETELLVAHFGARMREHGDTTIERLVGNAVVAIAIGHPTAERTNALTTEQREADTRANAAAFAARCRAVGLADEAAWAVQQAERGIALKAALQSVRQGDDAIFGSDIDIHLSQAWRCWSLGVFAGLEALLLAGLWLLSRLPKWRAEPLPWRAHHAAGVVVLVVGGWLVALYLAMASAHSSGLSLGLRPYLVYLWAAPVVALLLALLALGGPYARRVGAPRWQLERFIGWVLEAGPWTMPPRIEFVRRSWAALALPLALGFLALALSWKVPTAMAFERAGQLAPRVIELETERLDRELARQSTSGVRSGGAP